MQEALPIIAGVVGLIGLIATIIIATSKITTSFNTSVESIRLDINTEMEKLEQRFTETFMQRKQEVDGKVAGIYRRMDEIQAFTEGRYASKELMSVMHEGTAKNIGMLERKIDESRIEIRGELTELRKMVQTVVTRSPQ